MLGTSMVEMVVDVEKQTAVISSPKSKTDYVIYKPRDQTAFFKVRTTVGSLPSELSGHYSTLNKAIQLVSHYVEHSKETFAVRSDRLDKERKERHAAKSNSKDSQQLQSGSDNGVLGA